jgi:hypothetical protein
MSALKGRIAAATAFMMILAAAGSVAADVSVSVNVEPVVAPVGSEITMVVTVKGKFRKSSTPELPPLDDFSVYQAGTSQSFSFGTGGSTSSLIFTYILVPKKPGKYTISPVRFESGDKIYTAEPVTIEVVKPQSQVAPPGTGDGAVIDADEDRPLFIQASVVDDTVYVNQQITWTLGFFTDGRIDLMRTPEYSPPSAEGFWVEDLPPQKNFYKQIKGRQYLVNEIKRGFFAAAPGSYTIGAARVDLLIDDIGRSSRSNRADDFFSRSLRSFRFGKPVKLQTREIPITVLPLPKKGKPAGFSGLVGKDLELSVWTDTQVARVGEPVNLTLEIQGDGNFKTMSAPALPSLGEFKMYESGTTSDLYKEGYVVSGRKKYEYVLIPKLEGKHTVPAVRMSYFDPDEKMYKTIASAPINIDVMPGTEDESRRVIFAGSGEDIKVIGEDIRYIHPAPAVIRLSGGSLLSNKVYLALHALPLLALAASLAVDRRRKRFKGNVRLARASRAEREALKKLDAARSSMKKKDFDGVYPLVSGAVRGYIADKLNVSEAGLTSDDIEHFASGRHVDDGDLGELRSVLNACDVARFARSGSIAGDTRAAEDLVSRAADVIRRLEKRCTS